MKRILALAVCLVILSQISFSQDRKPHPAAPTKGYYAIGRNAEKLRVKHKQASRVEDPYVYTDKGYYALRNNRQWLPWRSAIKAAVVPQASEIRKGYYSIGNNAQKLGK